jgi:hydrogenase expression/formation protein HypD
MKEFQDTSLIRQVTSSIHQAAEKLNGKPVKFMEVCGSHTMAIGHWGIRKLIPETIKLISGPGCPVCVTPSSVIDELIRLKGVTIATFGDLLRVPGSLGNLEEARARGARVETIYSPLEALKLAEKEETILVGIGFETTIPGIAHTILEAQRRKLKYFSVFCLAKLIPPALEALLRDDQAAINGFILPGHVSVIIGLKAYTFLSERFRIGGVVTGFEPLDILLGILRLLEQLPNPEIINEYSRVVKPQGNEEAQKMIKKVFGVSPALWRGLGWLPDSGLVIRGEYEEYDAQKRYNLRVRETEPHPECLCGEMLRGRIKATDCPLFAKTCTPVHPVGPCMVSSEGSCAAHYKYER